MRRHDETCGADTCLLAFATRKLPHICIQESLYGSVLNFCEQGPSFSKGHSCAKHARYCAMAQCSRLTSWSLWIKHEQHKSLRLRNQDEVICVST